MQYIVYPSPIGGWQFEIWDGDRLVDNGAAGSQFDAWRMAVLAWARALRAQA